MVTLGRDISVPVRTGLIVVRNTLRVVHRRSGNECFRQQSYLGRHSGRLPSLILGGILEGYPDCTAGGIRGKQGFNDEELDISLEDHLVYPSVSPPHF